MKNPVRFRKLGRNLIIIVTGFVLLISFQNCGNLKSTSSSLHSDLTNTATPIWYTSLQYEADNNAVYEDCSLPTEAEMNNENVGAKNSYGSATSNNSYLSVDLGSEKNVNRIAVGGEGPSDCWGEAGSYWNDEAAEIEIQVSSDNINWTKVASGDQVVYSNISIKSLYFDIQKTRYVRIYLQSGWLATGSFRVGYDPNEFETAKPEPNDYDAVNDLPVVSINTGTDSWYSGINYTTIEGADQYGTCEMPTEANMNTGTIDNTSRRSYGSGSSSIAWLKADLGSVKPVNEILVGGAPSACWGGAAIYWNSGKIAVQVSVDGTSWTSVALGSHISYSDSELTPIYFQNTNARYIRLYIENGWLATGQFRIGFKQ